MKKKKSYLWELIDKQIFGERRRLAAFHVLRKPPNYGSSPTTGPAGPPPVCDHRRVVCVADRGLEPPR